MATLRDNTGNTAGVAKFGGTSAVRQRTASKFIAGNWTVTDFTVKINEDTGNPTGDIQIGIFTDSSGVPSTTQVGGYATITAVDANVGITFTSFTRSLSSSASLTLGTTYWLVIRVASGESDSAYYSSQAITTAATNNGAKYGEPTAGVWTNTNEDLYYTLTGTSSDTIQFDAFSAGETSGTTSHTQSHTCSGSNRILIVGVYDQSGNTVTGVTYNGVSLTQINTVTVPADNNVYLYYLIAPATGANNIVVSRSGSSGALVARGSSYTGVKQSGQPDAQVTDTDNSVAITTVADNCWTVAIARNVDGSITSGLNYTVRGAASSIRFGDSNIALTPAGSKTVTATVPSGTSGICVASLALFLAIAPSVSDTVTITESTTLNQVYIISVSDTVTVSENITLLITALRPEVSDTVAITESVTVVKIETLSVFDTITIAENFELAQIGAISVFGSIAVSENTTLTIVSLSSVFDSITISESVTPLITILYLDVNDTVMASESVTPLITILYPSSFDVINVTENVSLLITILYLSVSDSIAVAESVSILITILVPSVNDAITVSENISIFYSLLNVSPSDLITVTESFSSEYIIFAPQRPINRPKGYAASLTGYTIGGGRDSLAGLTTGGY